jgi:hypothetical protein
MAFLPPAFSCKASATFYRHLFAATNSQAWTAVFHLGCLCGLPKIFSRWRTFATYLAHTLWLFSCGFLSLDAITFFFGY